MKRICSSLLLVAASAVFSFFISFSPARVNAAEHHVPSEFLTIQDAISSATFTAGDSVVVAPGIYAGPITLPNNVTLRGTETARTILTGNGGGPVVIVDGTGAILQGSVNIQNFTFVNASSGISISNNSLNLINVSVKNNVFQGLRGPAITEQFSGSLRVANNTFNQNVAALSCDSDLDISNNIFSGNGTAIADTAPFISRISNNAFFNNSGNVVSGTSGTTGTFPIGGDPLFVEPANLDFHLKEGSPCIGTGNNSSTPNDIGAYGGSSADTIPFKVSGLSITSTTDTSIDLTWLPNNCYLVTNTTPTMAGGYNLYVGSASGVYKCDLASCGTASSPINVGASTSYTLTGLTSSSTPLDAPVLDQPSPRDSRLVLTWSAISGATGYQVHYGISSLDEHEPIDVGNTTSYDLSGLTNNQTYLVAISAYARQQFFFVVTAYDNQFKDSASTPMHESIFSDETSSQIGSTRHSGLSNVQSDFPESVITYPALPDSGGRCFIATAAYGYYSAPEVQALRAFRDRYLLASAPGRMFVQWYYQHGPAAAALLNDHPGYKPMVRAALMPAVGAAIFMTGTSMMFKAIMCLVLAAAIAFGFFRKRLSRTGELR
jgi:hypothetical protein